MPITFEELLKLKFVKCDSDADGVFHRETSSNTKFFLKIVAYLFLKKIPGCLTIDLF